VVAGSSASGHQVASTFDLERIVPDELSGDPFEQETLEIHAARYRFAARWVSGKRVLDLACGVGYGSAILKIAGAAQVIGVDRSEQAVAYARERYVAPGVSFVCSDGATFTPDGPFDVVVSLETIEHVTDVHGFVAQLARFIVPQGVLVGSVPTTLSSDVNPYHLHDLSADEFRGMFAANGFALIDEMIQVQSFSPLRLRRLAGQSARNYQLRPNLGHYYATHPGMLWRRLRATLSHGFANHYLVLVGRKS
jgi:SAM-dependent methyltransferase